MSATTILRKRGFHALAQPSSDFVYFPEAFPQQDVWLFAISRSGTTSETLWAVDAFRERYPDSRVIAISCVPDAALAQKADIALLAPDGQDKSVAQARSFTSMLLLAEALAALVAGDERRLVELSTLPDRLKRVLERAGDLPEVLGSDLDISRFLFLGGWPLYGLACEAMLKTKEMTVSWSEAFHPLEFRHGLMSVVNRETLMIGFVSDSAAEAEIKVLRLMKELGARILTIVEDEAGLNVAGLDAVVELKSGLGESVRGPLYLPLIQ